MGDFQSSMVYLDFPIWIRFAHFINLIFITLLIRSGIEILSALPKLYWYDHATPGTERIKFTEKQFPPDLRKRVWISLEEEESFSSWIVFTSNEWARLIPTSWTIIPQAFHTAMIYASFHFPPVDNPYNQVQQLTYFGVVFLL